MRLIKIGSKAMKQLGRIFVFYMITQLQVLTGIYGQELEFAPIGAKWKLEERFAFSTNIDFIELEVIGDTVLREELCKVLARNQASCNFRPSQEFMFKKNRKIYYYDERNDDFNLLYDFGVAKDSSWNMIVMDGVFYEELNPLPIFVDTVYYQEINGIDSVQIQEVKVGNEDDQRSFKLYENIGLEIGLFFVPWAFCDGNFETFIRCYSDENYGLVSFVDYDCNLVDIPSVEDQFSPITISPNPSKDYIRIVGTTSNITKAEILDLNGRLVQDIPELQSEIKLMYIQRGIYILRIRRGSGKVECYKFIKE